MEGACSGGEAAWLACQVRVCIVWGGEGGLPGGIRCMCVYVVGDYQGEMGCARVCVCSWGVNLCTAHYPPIERCPSNRTRRDAAHGTPHVAHHAAHGTHHAAHGTRCPWRTHHTAHHAAHGTRHTAHRAPPCAGRRPGTSKPSEATELVLTPRDLASALQHDTMLCRCGAAVAGMVGWGHSSSSSSSREGGEGTS